MASKPKKIPIQKPLPVGPKVDGPIGKQDLGKNLDDSKKLLQSIAGDDSIKGTQGRPYRLLASKGQNKLYMNLSYGDSVVHLHKDKGIRAAGLILRFRGKGKEMPVPGREDPDDTGLLKKYFVGITVGPVNGFTLREKVKATGVLELTYNWIAARMKEKKWTLEISPEDFELYGLSPFDSLPDTPEALESIQFPEW